MRRSIVFVAAVLALALAAPATSLATTNSSQKLRCKAGQKAVTVKGKAKCVAAEATKKKAAAAVHVQILGINDFHGNLQPPTGSNGRVVTSISNGTPVTVDAGGAEYLATWYKQLRTQNPANTLLTSSGDLIGASPLLSGLFHDEPTIEAFNAIGLQYNGVGNHEFDEGVPELLRMQFGGCHPVHGCQDGTPFMGALFHFPRVSRD
jgi:5'-nucleotidase